MDRLVGRRSVHTPAAATASLSSAVRRAIAKSLGAVRRAIRASSVRPPALRRRRQPVAALSTTPPHHGVSLAGAPSRATAMGYGASALAPGQVGRWGVDRGPLGEVVAAWASAEAELATRDLRGCRRRAGASPGSWCCGDSNLRRIVVPGATWSDDVVAGARVVPAARGRIDDADSHGFRGAWATRWPAQRSRRRRPHKRTRGDASHALFLRHGVRDGSGIGARDPRPRGRSRRVVGSTDAEIDNSRPVPAKAVREWDSDCACAAVSWPLWLSTGTLAVAGPDQ